MNGENPAAAVLDIKGECTITCSLKGTFKGKGIISARPEQLFFDEKEGLPGKLSYPPSWVISLNMRLNWITDRPYSLTSITKDVRELRPDGQRVKVNFDINAVVGVYDAGTQGGDFHGKVAQKLDFWFWVKVLVVGFMLIFLFYPFCTLITRSFFKMRLVLPWRTISGSLQKILLQCPGAKPVRIRGHHTHNLSGGCAHCLCYVQV